MQQLSRRQLLCGLATAPLITATAAQAATHAVTIKGFSFAPGTLTIKAGDTITFTNEDGAPHTATAKDKSFDTGRLNRSEGKSVTFNSKGTFAYFCRFHPNMTGTITVT